MFTDTPGVTGHALVTASYVLEGVHAGIASVQIGQPDSFSTGLNFIPASNSLQHVDVPLLSGTFVPVGVPLLFTMTLRTEISLTCPAGVSCHATSDFFNSFGFNPGALNGGLYPPGDASVTSADYYISNGAFNPPAAELPRFISEVPEPTVASLSAAALIGLGVIRHRRNSTPKPKRRWPTPGPA